MPASLGNLINEKAQVSVPLDPKDPDGDQFTITYRVGAITEEAMEAAVEAGNENGTGVAGQASNLVIAWVESWDLKWNESDSEFIPLTLESVRKIPLILLNSWTAAIVSDRSPDPKAKKTSRGR